jgi:asparagine N-glycosylation enzyme membrane subunit Stt3
MFLLPAAISGGFLTTKFGRYRPLHLIGYALLAIAFGLLSTLTLTSSAAAWVLYQAIAAIGSGLVLSSLIAAIQADLSDADNASSIAVFAFIRNFGAVWGLTIPAVVFNNQFDRLAYKISDPVVRALFVGGNAYSHASRKFISSFGNATRDEIVQTYTDTLNLVWQVAIPICGICFFLVFVEKEIKLRTELKTEYGMKTREKTVEDVPEGVA